MLGDFFLFGQIYQFLEREHCFIDFKRQLKYSGLHPSTSIPVLFCYRKRGIFLVSWGFMAFFLFSVGYGVSLQSSFEIKSNERRKDLYRSW